MSTPDRDSLGRFIRYAIEEANSQKLGFTAYLLNLAYGSLATSAPNMVPQRSAASELQDKRLQ